jgi:hypothetical protein
MLCKELLSTKGKKNSLPGFEGLKKEIKKKKRKTYMHMEFLK